MDIIQRNNTNGQFIDGWSGYKTCVRCNNEFLARSGIAKICDGCKKCEHCDTKTSVRYEWANISHQYKRDLDDWMELCKKCHMAYDKGLSSIKEIYG